MDSDADMDAPQISTLREEATPPPNSTRTGRFRVKLLVNEKRPGTRFISFNGQTGEEAGVSDADVDVEGDDGEDEKMASAKDEDEEAEAEDREEGEEEDQLIDDEDDQPTVGSSTPSPAKGVASKRGRGKATGKRKRVENVAEASPPEKPPKKKAGVKASPAAQKTSRKTSAKAKTTIKIPPLAEVPPAELSESYTGTAPSSPAHEPPSPTASAAPSVSAPGPSTSTSAVLPFNESDVPPPTAITAPLPASADSLLQTPLPRYPLPTKPFPVQAAPKIATGYAPALPLDRSGKKPRHWRLANREIRGIAGGRWFARSWVGDKESELTTASASHAPPHVVSISELTLPKLPALTFAPGGKGRGRKPEVVSTPASSRSVSTVPEVQSVRPAKKKSGLSKATPLPDEDMYDCDESVDGGV